MPITGVHTILYTSEPEALREVLGRAFGWASVDAGGGWLIFALPPAEMGVHPAESAHHEVTFMCDDMESTVAELRSQGIEFQGDPENQRFGIVTHMLLPGDVTVMLYQPHHPTAI